jgi:serine/threonine protein kinase/thioredoxin-like negative regulator of GroEL
VLTPLPEDAAETILTGMSPRVSAPPADTTGLPVSAGGRPQAARGPLEVGQQFGARYHILRELGIGGMGAVYQAWDAELSVTVALKVIRPEVTRDPVAAQDIERRFKQELLLARQVTHKNVVRIHDLGELNGIKYITMPYIEGSDLATVLRDERLPVPKVMALARQIAAGLQAAHEAGVVHRDLKPANVMIDHDHAIIMDFGIARSTSRGGPTPARAPAPTGSGVLDIAVDDDVTRAAATIAGEVIGTIEYMAPEQARGEHADQRADVYAFGLIVYDMLIGRRRSEHAVSAVGELQNRLAQAPPPVRSIVPEVPLPLDQLVTKCTEPDAAKRYQTTTELVAALDRLDDKGEPIPIKRTVRLPYAIAAIVLLLAISVGVWWYQRQFIPPTKHDNVKVVIADFQNNTSDPSLAHTLEPVLKQALEGASFISAFDREGMTRTLGVRPPERLDEDAARAIAVKQGVGVVLAGSLESLGSGGYRISVQAKQAVTGTVITSAQGRASSKDQILNAATRLITRVRTALGDETSESEQMFAMASLSATSLEVVGQYAAGREAASNNRYDEARRSYLKAVGLDPKFGIGYQALANVSLNQANQPDAEKYIREAMRYVTGMTQHERYTTRAAFYRITGDYRQCQKEYSDLLAAYPADIAAHNNLAICWANLRNFPKALDEVRQVVTILPNRALYRVNLAMYANFSTQFQTAEQEARKIPEPGLNALIALAFAQLGQGQFAEATDTYKTVAAIGEFGASLATAGLADVANLEGRFADAARILEEGATQDLAAKRQDWAAGKLAALVQTQLWRGQKRAAIAAAEKALLNSNGQNVQFLVARAFIEAGEFERARALMKALASEVRAEPQAYAKILEGELALKTGDPRQAIEVLTQANALLDTWLGHFDLGRAFFDAKQFPQADSEFERCINRRGEALQLIMGDDLTYSHLPTVYYYQGRVREEMKTEGYGDSYREYLKFRGASREDPLVKEVRKRAGE